MRRSALPSPGRRARARHPRVAPARLSRRLPSAAVGSAPDRRPRRRALRAVRQSASLARRRLLGDAHPLERALEGSEGSRSAAVLRDSAAGAPAEAGGARGVAIRSRDGGRARAIRRGEGRDACAQARVRQRARRHARVRHAAAGAEEHPELAHLARAGGSRRSGSTPRAPQSDREGRRRHAQRRRARAVRGQLAQLPARAERAARSAADRDVPVAVRAKDDVGGGNSVGAILASLATNIEDPGRAIPRDRRVDAARQGAAPGHVEGRDHPVQRAADRAVAVADGSDDRRPREADVQRRDLERARAGRSAVLPRRAARGEVSDVDSDARPGAQHHVQTATRG